MVIADDLRAADLSQLERKELARGAWREGQVENALLILETVMQEEMRPRVAGELLVTKASFQCALKDFAGASRSLKDAAEFIDLCDARVRGSFYFHRALVHRNEEDIAAALTDYAGSLIYWQEAGDTDYEIAARINLAELHLLRDDPQQARKEIDQAFELLTPQSTHYCNAYDTKAKILLRQGELGKAVIHARVAIEAAGENEIWKADALATFESIKAKVLEGAERVLTVKDLKDLKRRIIENALQASGGSVVEAARLLDTSHQLIAYTAAAKGLARSARRKKSIIKVIH